MIEYQLHPIINFDPYHSLIGIPYERYPSRRKNKEIFALIPINTQAL